MRRLEADLRRPNRHRAAPSCRSRPGPQRTPAARRPIALGLLVLRLVVIASFYLLGAFGVWLTVYTFVRGMQPKLASRRQIGGI